MPGRKWATQGVFRPKVGSGPIARSHSSPPCSVNQMRMEIPAPTTEHDGAMELLQDACGWSFLSMGGRAPMRLLRLA